MSAEAEVRAALEADLDLVALVGQRVYPYVAPAGVVSPFVIVKRAGTEFTQTIHDDMPVASKSTVSVSCWSASRDECDALADLVQIAMRTTGPAVNRDGQYDPESGLRVAVVDFDVWQLTS